MNETEFQKISRKTGRKVSFCKCEKCKSQCKTPCMGTPSDIEKIIDAGYSNEYIKPTYWAHGLLSGVTDQLLDMFQALQTPTGCIFFKDGLCSLHDKGLKPTEGRLSHHILKAENYDRNKSLTWNVAKTWLDPDNAETIKRIEEKLNPEII